MCGGLTYNLRCTKYYQMILNVDIYTCFIMLIFLNQLKTKLRHTISTIILNHCLHSPKMITTAEYEKNLKACFKNTEIKQNIFDFILQRSHTQKLQTYCHYSCSKLQNINHYKLNGRYPFKIIFNCTEFCSALFSLLNLVVNVILYHRHLKKNLVHTKLDNLLKLQSFVFCFCWISSTLFHVNDIIVTRYLDYFSALLFLIFSFYLAVKRLSYFYSKNTTIMLQKTAQLLCCIYLSTVLYMIFVNFNYKLHKFLCGFFLVCTTAVWLHTYGLIRKHAYSRFLLYYIFCLYFGILVEIADMPPFLYLVDSHAIWHFITACIAPFYYKYAKEDMLHKNCIKNVQKIK